MTTTLQLDIERAVVAPVRVSFADKSEEEAYAAGDTVLRKAVAIMMRVVTELEEARCLLRSLQEPETLYLQPGLPMYQVTCTDCQDLFVSPFNVTQRCRPCQLVTLMSHIRYAQEFVKEQDQ